MYYKYIYSRPLCGGLGFQSSLGLFDACHPLCHWWPKTYCKKQNKYSLRKIVHILVVKGPDGFTSAIWTWGYPSSFKSVCGSYKSTDLQQCVFKVWMLMIIWWPYGGRQVQTHYNGPNDFHQQKPAAASDTMQIQKHKCVFVWPVCFDIFLFLYLDRFRSCRAFPPMEVSWAAEAHSPP